MDIQNTAQKKIIFVTGIPGSGKTTLYHNLQQDKLFFSQTVFYDKDKLNEILLSMFNSSTEQRSGVIYETFVRSVTYLILEEIARMDILSLPKTKEHFTLFLQNISNVSFIDKISFSLTSSFFSPVTYPHYVFILGTYSTEVYDSQKATALYVRWQKIAEETNSQLLHFRCIAPRELILKRLAHRNFIRDISKLQNPNAFFEQEPIECASVLKPIYLNTLLEFQEQLNIILSYLQK